MNRVLPLAIPILMAAGCSHYEARVSAAGGEPSATVQVETVGNSEIADI